MKKVGEPRQITIMLADDHQVVRFGLKTMLETIEDFELIGEATNGKEIIDLCKSSPSDVVLMDLRMPDIDGIEAIKVIKSFNSSIAIIALTSFGSEELVDDALAAGASGYLIKNVSSEVLENAIRNVVFGNTVLAPEVTSLIVNRRHKISNDHLSLTQREQEILILLSKGLTNSEIATRCEISISTVKTHVGNIFSKFNVSTRTEAVRYAIDQDMFGNIG